MIAHTLKIAMLYDFYGALLTERQKKYIELHYLDDLSLAEIAGEFLVTRQAVHDTLKRAVRAMQELEDKLCLVKRYEQEQEELKDISLLLRAALRVPGGKPPQILAAEQKIQKLLKGGL